MKTDTFRGSERGLGEARFCWNLVETSLWVVQIYTLRTRNFDRIPKVGPESVSRHPRSTGMVVGSASTVRSYSPDNMNESCVPRLGGGVLMDECAPLASQGV